MSNPPPVEPSQEPAEERPVKPSSAQPRVEVMFDQLLGTVQVPTNIDPALFDTWYNNEIRSIRGEIENENEIAKEVKPPRGLGRVMAAYIGVMAMLVAILMGLLRGTSAPAILDTACWTLIGFTVIGYLAGLIAEHTVRESVETAVREVVRRSDEAGQQRGNG